MAVGAKIVGWKRIDLPEYPIEAFREAVVNAIVHRDYSRTGESIRVFYYSARVEIHNAHDHGSILNREYRELTGVSGQTALRDLEALVDQGKLKRVGKTRSRQYKMPSGI
ncbi:MAG: hypothetical protein ACJ8DI_06205 [Ktedonobacteraceae bacterium]